MWKKYHDNYSFHFCHWLCGHIWYLKLPSPNIHSVFLLSSASFSAGHGSLPGEVTQTFISEGSSSLLVPRGLGFCGFSLTLITENGNIL